MPGRRQREREVADPAEQIQNRLARLGGQPLLRQAHHSLVKPGVNLDKVTGGKGQPDIIYLIVK